ncbi:hypothetical protein NQ318_012753 [Aromia moschata]|uniref:DUF4817 domain-containing protein n=1 Tax=Aromia moschata TaxID=1265417 RepID=A0AAV8X3N8_9CUCU|nr:hypothetical protein NQ318_012753 [Aromia moschata]
MNWSKSLNGSVSKPESIKGSRSALAEMQNLKIPENETGKISKMDRPIFTRHGRSACVFVLQFREMVYLTEMHKITILQMIGYGDRTRTQAEVVRLFQEKYPELTPISQGTVSKIEKQFRERGHVRQLKKNPTNKLSDDQKLEVMLMLEENPHTSSRQTASALNISHSSILRVLTENQMPPYKLVPTNELAEDDFDRGILFCEQMMQMIDGNTLQTENVCSRPC